MIGENGLSELPRGWTWTKIGELVEFQYGKALTENNRDQSGEIPVYGSNGIVGKHSSGNVLLWLKLVLSFLTWGLLEVTADNI